MCEPAFTREEELRMRALVSKKEKGETFTADEVAELNSIESRYQVFIEEGQRRLREGAARASAASSASGSGQPTSVGEALARASKAAYFWGSLVGTALPGYFGRKAGVTTDFLHWNYIIDNLILGALPVVTQVGSSGNHLAVLKEQLDLRGESLGLVVACLEADELDGFGLGVLQFAKEEDWRSHVNSNVKYIQLPMEDTTAKVGFDTVARAVEAVHQCISKDHRTVYVHCSKGKGRSYMVVMCYLTTFAGMTYEDAEKLVKLKRSQVRPSVAQQCFAQEFPLHFATWRSLKDATSPATASPTQSQASPQQPRAEQPAQEPSQGVKTASPPLPPSVEAAPRTSTPLQLS